MKDQEEWTRLTSVVYNHHNEMNTPRGLSTPGTYFLLFQISMPIHPSTQ